MSTSSVKNATQNSSTWRDAVVDAITFYTNANLCFSSGEIAAELRTHRPDLKFSVLNLGEYVRDLFYNGAVNYKDEDDEDLAAVQVPRTTSGVGRTPAGRTVFVYSPDFVSGQSHAFEVDIPSPGQKAASASPFKVRGGGYPTAVTASDDGDGAAALPAAGDSSAAGEYRATVHTDRRLCITRPIFDQFIAASGRPIRGGDSIFILLDDENEKAHIFIDDPGDDDAKKYDLSKERGRVLFCRTANPFQPGDRYKVVIAKDRLTVDLSAPIA